MRIHKEAQGGYRWKAGEDDLEEINRLSRKKLRGEEVYTFGVRLCDNEVDRDFECFDRAALEKLGELFVGKSGIFDHQWSAAGQTARLYRTELVEEEDILTQRGEPYCYLKGYAYMVRTEGNRDLIAEIDGGIKKEVSVGCAVRRTVCSICGKTMGEGECRHVKGQRYDGALCFGVLQEPTDAYEWSFVAVPAQPMAGVVKGMKKEERNMNLKEFLREKPEYLAQLESLEKEAELGRSYLKGLRREVVRLGLMAQPELGDGVMERIADKLDEAELVALKGCYEKQAGERYPITTQLTYGGEREERTQADAVFLI